MRRTASVWFLLILVVASHSAAQDPVWLRMWEDAQRQRPRSLSSKGRIAPPTEPGTPMTVRGRVVLQDGKTPGKDVVVFVYQTDATGVYNRDGAQGWRLRGWARTDARGTFEFQTIRPEPYPGRSIPAHFHFYLEGPGVPRQGAGEIRFADDSLVSAREREASERDGAFGHVRPVSVHDGVLSIDVTLRPSGAELF